MYYAPIGQEFRQSRAGMLASVPWFLGPHLGTLERLRRLRCLRDGIIRGFFTETTEPRWFKSYTQLELLTRVLTNSFPRVWWPQGNSSFYVVAQESKSEYSREHSGLCMAFSDLASLLLYSICWSRHNPIRFKRKVLRPLHLNEGRNYNFKMVTM